jgi:thymidylate kinase
MENKLLDFLNELDERNIKYVSWKNNHEIELSINGESDLDIHIPLKYRDKFFQLLLKNYWISVFNPVAVYPFVEHYYLISDENKIYHLHVYFKIVTGESWLKEFDLPLSEFLIENRLKSNGLYILNNKSQSYLFAIRHVLKCGSITSRILYSKEFDSYKSEWLLCNYDASKLQGYGPLSLDDVIDSSGLLYGFELSSYFNSFIFRMKLAPHLRLSYIALPIYRLISFFRRLLNKFLFKRKKLFKGRGAVIAISGVDGSGKSSMIDAVNSCLSKFLTIKTLSLGKPQGRLLEFLRKSTSNKNPNSGWSSKNNSIHYTSLFKSISLLVLAILRLFESWKSQYYINSGYIVLVDRWPTREFGKMDGPKIYVNNTSSGLVKLLSKLEGLIYHAIPAAEVCFFLDVSVDTAIKRNSMRIKDDKETESEIRERHMENKMIEPVTKKFIRFNNDGPFEEKKTELLLLVRNELVNVSMCQ